MYQAKLILKLISPVKKPVPIISILISLIFSQDWVSGLFPLLSEDLHILDQVPHLHKNNYNKYYHETDFGKYSIPAEN